MNSSTTNEPHQWQVLKKTETFGNSLLLYPLLELTVCRHYVNSPCYVKYWNSDYNFESTRFSAK